MMPLHARSVGSTTIPSVLDQPPPWLQPRLRALLQATTVESATRFRFADLEPFELPTPGVMPPTGVGGSAGIDPQAFGGFGVHPLAEVMWQVLYNYGYARPFDGTAAKLPTTPIARVDEVFMKEVQAANHGRERWDGLWNVYRAEADGAVHIEKSGNRRRAEPGQYMLASGQGGAAGIGDLVNCHVASESADSQPGFYYAMSETVASDHDDSHLGRLYFHLPAVEVPWLLSWLTRNLNRNRIPYRIKCLTNPVLYDRSDPVVLYVAKRFLQPTLRVLANRRQELERRLLGEVPLCSKPLLAGLGVADEPGNARSFGQTRSYILAQAILDAWASGEDAYDKRLACASFRFKQLGLSLSQPHLSENSADLYQWPKAVRLETH